ncbi:MAG: glycine-rich protein [Solirubrobacteraceae bacterium]
MSRAIRICVFFCVSALFAITATSRADTTITFDYTGAEQTLAIPAGVTSVSVLAVGGMGAPEPVVPPAVFGGYGAVVSGAVSVKPASTLYVEVGGNGRNTAGGFNGGGDSNGGAGGGGGASDVQTCSITAASYLDGDPLLSRLLIAAGGGGAGYPGGSVSAVGAGGNAGEPGGSGGGGVYGGDGVAPGHVE